MDDTEETEELMSVKDQIVFGVGTLLVIASTGVIAHIGWDLYGEAKVSWKRHQAAKKES